MILDLDEKVELLYDKLLEREYDKKLKIIKYSSEDFPGYSYIKIYNKNASKENMLTILKEKYGFGEILTFGTTLGRYDVTIEENNFNKMVREVRKRYEPFLGIRRKNNSV